MATIETLRLQADALRTAIATGVKRVEFSDASGGSKTTTEYQDTTQMMKALNMIRSEISAMESVSNSNYRTPKVSRTSLSSRNGM